MKYHLVLVVFPHHTQAKSDIERLIIIHPAKQQEECLCSYFQCNQLFILQDAFWALSVLITNSHKHSMHGMCISLQYIFVSKIIECTTQI